MVVLRETLLWPGKQVVEASAARILVDTGHADVVVAEYRNATTDRSRINDLSCVWEWIIDTELVCRVRLGAWATDDNHGRVFRKELPESVRISTDATAVLRQLGITQGEYRAAFQHHPEPPTDAVPPGA